MEGNGYATRDAILGAPPTRRYVEVEVHGHKFRIRSLTAGEAMKCQAKHLAEDEVEKRARAIATLPCRTIAQCIVDGQNHRVFSDKDVAALMDLDARFVADLTKECRKHAGIDEDDEDDAKKNLNEKPDSGLPISLPAAQGT